MIREFLRDTIEYVREYDPLDSNHTAPLGWFL